MGEKETGRIRERVRERERERERKIERKRRKHTKNDRKKDNPEKIEGADMCEDEDGRKKMNQEETYCRQRLRE